MKKTTFTITVTLLPALGMAAPAVQAAAPSTGSGQGKPNIVVIWGNDIGYWNLSASNQGMMGYKTPNIDCIAWRPLRTASTGMR